eukprot:2509693-Amphidinium_carterae.1
MEQNLEERNHVIGLITMAWRLCSDHDEVKARLTAKFAPAPPATPPPALPSGLPGVTTVAAKRATE